MPTKTVNKAGLHAELGSGMKEADLQREVIAWLRAHGWQVNHTADSRKSEPSALDLECIRPPRYVRVELKTERGTLRKGKRTKAGRYMIGQDEMIAMLEQCPGVEVYLWRPQHWLDGTIERTMA